MRTLIVLSCIAVALASAGRIGDPTKFEMIGERPACHNITGTCLPHGFVCANEEVVPYGKRCDGVEDCADGTDEFMCHHEDHRPLAERTEAERFEAQQSSCIKCTCVASVIQVVSGSAWFTYATKAPTDFLGLMTGSGTYAGRPCNPTCIFNIKMGFYKKNRICRGWLCCARQRECTQCQSAAPCTGFTTGNRCYA